MPEQIAVRGVRNGATDFIEVPTAEEAYIAALLRERRGYEMRGDSQGVADVDAEIVRVGAKPAGCDGVNCRLMHPHEGPKVPRNSRGNTNGRKR